MNIEKYIKETDWKFSDLLQLEKTSREVAEKLYDEITISDMISNLWGEEVHADGTSFGLLYMNLAMEYLTNQVMEAFQKHFESATVKFEGVEPKVIEEPELAPPPPKPKTINKKLTSDGTNLPPGVERL